MSAFWRSWLNVWAWVVIVFGLVLAGGGLDATDTVANAVSNTGLAIGYLVPVLASGAMNGFAPAANSQPSVRARQVH